MCTAAKMLPCQCITHPRFVHIEWRSRPHSVVGFMRELQIHKVQLIRLCISFINYTPSTTSRTETQCGDVLAFITYKLPIHLCHHTHTMRFSGGVQMIMLKLHLASLGCSVLQTPPQPAPAAKRRDAFPNRHYSYGGDGPALECVAHTERSKTLMSHVLICIMFADGQPQTPTTNVAAAAAAIVRILGLAFITERFAFPCAHVANSGARLFTTKQKRSMGIEKCVLAGVRRVRRCVRMRHAEYRVCVCRHRV